MFKTRTATAVVAFAAIAALTLTGCSSGGTSTPSSSGSAVDAKTATSAADFGGLDQLVAAAKAEGTLNVIALPDDWANYGKIIAAFKTKYGLTVNSANPNGSSADEIKAAKDNKGQDTAPDVFDLGTAVALASTAQFAPYKVANWADIPDGNKESTGLWVNDYTGSMSIGYNSAKYPKPTSLDDLLKPDYKGAVAINGDPTQAGAAFAAIGLATVQNGGTLDDFQPGIDFFSKLNAAGNFLTVDPTPATIASGETGVVFDWSYNNLAQSAVVPGWKVTTLPGTAYISFYNQAINVDAPHPAAARLWQEFVFSPEAQNLFLAAGAYPVTIDAMVESGTVDKTVLDSVGELPKDRVTPTVEQTDAANTLLSKNWAAAIGQ
ncbi:ABC transporter substrate-binding protein [Glaciibacter psychrotolerans]|uniref:Putative spermidine/putrescine transport system substrate-binding protein n=1 Tax=Glaciibacter psychrotolerans TaxID=670054 RepID=A0A7Z0EFN2_9MICO|nr:ABC transporter substrate-binding protein [Leifsonia psychrotolerans]NYJ20771.1 putative spermidine/putrescine transport system substrate-binding protein [Leifsonia psychrotolerans]